MILTNHTVLPQGDAGELYIFKGNTFQNEKHLTFSK